MTARALTSSELEAAQRRHLAAATEPVVLTPATLQALDEFGAWLLLRGLRAETTIKQRRSILGMVARAVGGDLLAATDRDLAAWQRSRTFTAQSHRTYVSHVREFFKWAVAEGLVAEDPTGRLVRPKVARRLPRPIPEDALLRAVLTAPTSRIRAWLVLAGWAGLRAMEIAALRREDVHEAAQPPMLEVRDGKGNKGRAVPMSRLVVDELRPILEAHDGPDGWLFLAWDRTDRPVKAGSVSNHCNEHLRSLGLTNTLHTLRHRFASELYRVTLDLRLTQEMLGHASPATTAIYTAFSPGRAASAVDEIGT